MASKALTLLVALGLAGCSVARPADECRLDIASSQVYSVTDTTDWELGGMGGRRGVLRSVAQVIDSIDTNFGYHVIGQDSILYLQIRSSLEAGVILMDGPTDYVVVSPSGVSAISNVLPYFSVWASSPSVQGRCLSYWGFDNSDATTATYATRYHFGEDRSERVVLPIGPAYTDDMSYFIAPYRNEEGEEVFEYREGRYLVDWEASTARNSP